MAPRRKKKKAGKKPAQAEVPVSLAWKSGADSKHHFFDDAWLKFTGRSLEDEVDDGWEEGIHEEDRERWRGAYGKAFQLRKSFTIELRLRHHDESHRWIFAECKPLFDAEREFDGFSGQCLDIHEAREAEAAAQHYDLSFEALAGMTPLGVLRFGPSGRCRLVNAYWTEISGVPNHETLGEGWLDAFPPVEAVLAKEYLQRSLWEKEQVTFRCRIAEGDNQGAKVLIHARPEIDDSGLVHGAVATVRIQGRETGDVAGELEANRLEALSNLAGGIAHDFNNLLTPIILNLSALQSQVHQPAQLPRMRSRIREAQEAASLARNLVQQLLTFAKGGKPLKKKIDLDDLIRDAVDFAVIREAIEVEYALPEDLWPAEIDANQITQSIQGIVRNAEEAMPEGGTIQVTAENLNDVKNLRLGSLSGRHVHIRIRDQGPGIPREEATRVFDPYYTTKTHASGLGLAMSRSIIRQHEGEIVVDCQPGQGATISIYIPVRAAVESEKKPESKKTGDQKGRILIMDDEDLIRSSVRAILISMGYTVQLASDGTEALNIYKEALEKKRPIDLALMDITIQGGMGGEEAIGKLKEIDPEAVAVVCSGYANDPLMTDFGSYGFSGAIQKPFHPEDLGSVISELLCA